MLEETSSVASKSASWHGGRSRETVADYVIVINCTYANLNALLDPKIHPRRQYQFEICEKPLIKLPGAFRRQSIVIIDGPFACIDPYGKTDCHVIGNVVHAIHATNVGYYPEIPERLQSVLNRGVIKNPPITKFPLFIESISHFIPKIKTARHVGSMFTVRTVLPNLDKTDARPTMIELVGDKIINIFSGKIGTSVAAARQAVELVRRRFGTPVRLKAHRAIASLSQQNRRR